LKKGSKLLDISKKIDISNLEIIHIQGYRWWVRDKAFSYFLLELTSSFSSFLAQPYNQCIKRGKKKSLWEIRINEAGEKAYLVKSYLTANLLSKIKLFFKGSKALKEFKASHEVAERQIPTFLPSAAGEKRRTGLIEESYVVMEKVQGCTDLGKYFLQEEKAKDTKERKKVIDKLGRLTRKIHDQGILQTDLALNNFLIMKDQAGELQLFFSDFEKVKFLPTISESLRLKGLAKLNRVGNKVSLSERLRFLKAYLSTEPVDRRSFHGLVCHLRSLTLEALKRDGERKRMTSVYTDSHYKSYRDLEFRGLYRDGYEVEELLKVIQAWDKGVDGEAEVELKFKGIPKRTTVKCYQKNSGSKVWSHAFTLFLGTLPVILPHAFLERTGTSLEFIFFPQVERTLTLMEFLSRPESKGIAGLSKLLFKIHQFGTFSGKISEEIFSFPFEDNTVTPHIRDVDSFTIQKEITPQDRERDVSALISLLSPPPR
jgi:hypothetical protein